jgi:hypothetical protein
MEMSREEQSSTIYFLLEKRAPGSRGFEVYIHTKRSYAKVKKTTFRSSCEPPQFSAAEALLMTSFFRASSALRVGFMVVY